MSETNPTPPRESEEATPQLQPPPGLRESELQETESSRWPSWCVYLLKCAKWLVEVAAVLTTLLWILALVDSYRPKITISPGTSMNPKNPFDTMFIVQNQSLLPIFNVSYQFAWQEPPVSETQKNVNVFIGLDATIIPELKPLEAHSLWGGNYPAEIMPKNYVGCHIDVTYEPRFFGRRTDILYFWATRDVNGDWQWFPSGHHNAWDVKFRHLAMPPGTIPYPPKGQ